MRVIKSWHILLKVILGILKIYGVQKKDMEVELSLIQYLTPYI